MELLEKKFRYDADMSQLIVIIVQVKLYKYDNALRQKVKREKIEYKKMKRTDMVKVEQKDVSLK